MAISARYWRIYCTAVQPGADNRFAINELEVANSVGGADITNTSTPVTALSTSDGAPSKVFDGGLSYTTQNWVSGSLPAWLRFDLGATVPVHELRIWGQNHTGFIVRSPKDFLIQYSHDNVNWATSRTFTDVTGWVAGTAKTFQVFEVFKTIDGVIDEALAADRFVVRAYTIPNWVFSAMVETTDGTYSLLISPENAGPHQVTISADVGNVWKPGTVYALNAKVFPTDPAATPFYYKRIAVGTSGGTEPTWPTTPGAQVDDGSVSNAWELVERLIQPITHGPLIPI